MQRLVFVTVFLFVTVGFYYHIENNATKNKPSVKSSMQDDEESNSFVSSKRDDSAADDDDSRLTENTKESASKSISSFIVAASFDAVKDPEAPTLQRILTDSTRANVKNVSCLLEDVIEYPYQDEIRATALMSFPRSGNSWTRSLVEKSTGFATTAIYCESRRGFAYSCTYKNVFLVKTHRGNGIFTYRGRKRTFERLVYLVRNPFDSMLSYLKFKRSHGNNQRIIRKSDIGTKRELLVQELITIKTIQSFVDRYRSLFAAWKQLSLPTIIVRYEDLKASPVIVLRLIRRFLVPLRLDADQKEDDQDDDVQSLYYHDDPDAFTKHKQFKKYQKEEMEKLLCAVRTDLANQDLIYKTNKFDVLHSLKYYENATIKYVLQELREPLCFLQYGNLLEGIFGFTCDD